MLLYKVHPKLVKTFAFGCFAFVLNPLALAHLSKISAQQQKVLLGTSSEQRGMDGQQRLSLFPCMDSQAVPSLSDRL